VSYFEHIVELYAANPLARASRGAGADGLIVFSQSEEAPRLVFRTEPCGHDAFQAKLVLEGDICRRIDPQTYKSPTRSFPTNRSSAALGGWLASADSAPRVGFGFGIRDTFQGRLVGIFSGFLFFLVDFPLFGALRSVSALTAFHASHVLHFLRKS
jgi:hypothetical protein